MLARDAGNVLQAELLQRIGVERGHRRADVLQFLFALLRRHDDLGELVALGNRLLGPAGRRQRRARTGSDRKENRRCFSCHYAGSPGCGPEGS
jgi:hypothetical protein